jgi:hypothetical protein
MTPQDVKYWRLKPETDARLRKRGKFGESQDELINRILDRLTEYEEKNV